MTPPLDSQSTTVPKEKMLSAVSNGNRIFIVQLGASLNSKSKVWTKTELYNAF